MHGAFLKSRRSCRVFTPRKHKPHLPQVVELIHGGCNRFFVIGAAPNRCFHSLFKIRTDLCVALEIRIPFGINMHPLYFSSSA